MEGEACILGGPLQPGREIKVRKGRAIPVYCKTDSTFKIVLGEEASFHEVEGNTIPEDWYNVVEEILNVAKKDNSTVMVVGGVDVGKTTFTIFLANMALKRVLKVNLIDADIGQSDVGPPATIGTYHPDHYTYDLFYEKPDKLVFIGSTTPANTQTKIIKAVSSLCNESKQKFNLTVLNTDGWIEGEEAQNYKFRMAKETKTDFVVVFQFLDETINLVQRLRMEGLRVFEVKPSSYVKKRSREERRKLRWQAYQKYMQNAVIKNVRLGEVEILGLNCWKEGLLLGLYKDEKEFLGLGVLKGIDIRRGILKILTPVRESIHRIEVGQTTFELNLKPKQTQT